ncbi:hypothetical protein L083_3521 [Actinoplanes sp. N902-109]|nr:hypothetical protein L083_3521 [Actinoplanes sp. N902-109]
MPRMLAARLGLSLGWACRPAGAVARLGLSLSACCWASPVADGVVIRSAGAQLVLVFLPVDRVVPQRRLPSAVREAALGVFLRRARRLRDQVERGENQCESCPWGPPHHH